MPLPIVVDSIDSIPEAARGAYVARDGKHYLDAEIQNPSDALVAKNSELIGRNKTLAERAALIGDRSPEEVKADLELAALTRESKAKAEGDFETLKGQLIQQHTSEKEKLTGRTKKVEGKLFDVLAKREVERAIKELDGDEVVLLPHILPLVKVFEEDDDFTAKVVDEKGNLRIADGQATPMTIKQLVETFKANERFGVAFAASGASGSGAKNQGAAGAKAGAIMIPKEASPQEYRRLKDQAEKEGRPYAIAS